MAPFSSRFPSLSKKFKSKAKKGRKVTKNMEKSFKRLKSEMEEISEEQKSIREGQRQVKEKFQVIESECEELKRETGLIIQQSARTRVKLALMFRIIKAREAGELSVAANLTDMLRTSIETGLLSTELSSTKLGLQAKEEKKAAEYQWTLLNSETIDTTLL